MFQKIRKLVRDGQSNIDISNQLKIDRKTVAKYRESNSPPKYKARTKRTREDLFAPYSETVAQLLSAIDGISAGDVFEQIVNDGYEGSERTVQRRVSAIRAKKAKERYFEQEYEPGEQSQYDFKESVELPFVDGFRVCHLHFSTLPHSDTVFIKAFPFKNYEAFIDGCHSFFEHIGGLTDNVRIDNLSPCVSKILKGSRRVYTKSFQRAIDYYGFGVLPCSPGKGSEKGDVERDIRTWIRRIRTQIKITGRVFGDYGDLNAWLLDLVTKRRGVQTWRLLADEQERLNPLPPRDADILCTVDTGRASKHGMLRIERCKASYSVPDFAIEKECRFVVSALKVKIYLVAGDRSLIAVHERKPEGKSSILLEHVFPSLLRKPRAMIRWAHREILFPTDSFRRYYRFWQKRDREAAEREFLQAVNLIQYTTVAEIGIAMDLVVDASPEEAFDELRKILLVGGHRNQQGSYPRQDPVEPKLSQYDSLIPKHKKETAS